MGASLTSLAIMRTRITELVEGVLDPRPGLSKVLKYGTASVAGVVTSQVVLVFFFVVVGMGAAPSNVVAVAAGSVPNYLINRAWTFNKRGAHSFTREVLPFWGMALLGLLLSTVAVAAADQRWGTAIAVAAANIGAFGLLWVAKFFVLERVLFAPLVHAVEGETTPNI